MSIYTAVSLVSSPAPVRVRLRYTDLDMFVERFAVNVTRGGLFLASRTPRPVGEVLPFEVQLADGRVALAGEGKVTWVKDFNPAEPNKPHGMGVQFVRLDGASREILNRMLKIKTAAPRPGAPARVPTGPVAIVPPAAGRAPVHAPGNGIAPAPVLRVDTSVDLAAEYGLDEAALKRAVDRNRIPTGPNGMTAVAGRNLDGELDELTRPEAVDAVMLAPATLAEALAELPRLLEPRARRRTGTFRSADGPAATNAHLPDKPENGAIKR
jgi:uncharacterized protein (TIGR02266 family)